MGTSQAESWQSVRRKVAWGAACLLSLLALMLVFYLTELHHKKAMIGELQGALEKELQAIIITPDQVSRKWFTYRIENASDLRQFVAAASRADTRAVSGHSGPVYECTLELVFEGTRLRYLATVHGYEPEDLFISNVFWKGHAGRYSRGRAMPIRLPGLGRWIFRVAPQGSLGNLKNYPG
jgi:hypothetical protein